MINIGETKDKSAYPDVVVKICDELYAINSRYIIAITNMQSYNRMPGAPKEVLGVTDFRGEAVPLIDMRILFGLPTVKQKFDEFRNMIDERKTDHIKWVDKLEESASTGEKFTLAKDPHKCAFGKWFYSFKSDSPMVNHHMQKIEEPHRKLHEMAMEMDRCKLEDTEDSQDECARNVIKTAKQKYMERVLQLLDEAKTVFQSLYTEMMIVLEAEGSQIAIVIDEVLAVEELLEMNRSLTALPFRHSDYVCEVKQRKDTEELILELSDDRLLKSAEKLDKC